MRPPPIWVRKRWRLTDPLGKTQESTALNEQSRKSPTLFRRAASLGAKFRLGQLGRRTLAFVVVTAAIALAAATFLPLQRYRDQGNSIEQAKQELSQLEQRRSDLQRRLERAQDKTIIKREARKQMSLVEPGDELFRIVVPADVIDLPKGWHLPGVKYLVTGQSK